MPRAPSSFARYLVKISTPPFIDAYTEYPGTQNRVVPVEIFTMLLPSCKCGNSFWVKKYTLFKWIFKKVSNCSSVTVANGSVAPMPALLISTSIPLAPHAPSTACTRSTKAFKPCGALRSNCNATTRRPRAISSCTTDSACSTLALYVRIISIPFCASA